MLGFRSLVALTAVTLALGSCGELDAGRVELTGGSDARADRETQAAGEAVADGLPSDPAAREPVVRAAGTELGTQSVELEQPAVWPASEVVFTTPEEAAGDFVSQVFGVEPALSEFRAGDSRSGEIDVLFLGEGDGATPSVNSALLLRQLGPDGGWFVIGGRSEFAAINSPDAGAVVVVGPVAVEGMARGFEGTVVVSAFPAGNSGALLDQEITRGGSMEATEPFAVTLDLSGATPETSVAVLVRGDAGADGDTGEFSIIAVAVMDSLPELR
jgi:hypothetical protein